MLVIEGDVVTREKKGRAKVSREPGMETAIISPT